MIEKWKIQELNNTPIEMVAERLGLQVIRHKSRCPWHEDRHPSLSFDTRRNRYRCYVCDAHGGVIDMVMQLKGCGFKEACEWLGGPMVFEAVRQISEVTKRKEYKADLPYLQSLVAIPRLNLEAQEWLASRRIDERVVRWCRLSSIDVGTPCWRYGKAFYDAPSLLIPYYGADGSLMSVQSRYLGKEDKPRFRFPRGASCHVYNLQVIRLLEASEELWITEGCSDCWAMLSSGRKAIAIPSASMLKEEDLEPLKGLNLHMYPDQDEPGERLFLQLHKRLPQLVRHQLPSTCKDFGDLWSSANFVTYCDAE
jgi:hypothetical protein